MAKIYTQITTSIHSRKKKKMADEFMKDVQRIACMIQGLRRPTISNNLPASKPIRIAVLDTGIDNEDELIQGAIEDKDIIECVGFVNGSGDYQDTYGHGTHVARLLLETAPCAKILVAKVANCRTVPPRDLHQIEKVGGRY